VSIDKTRARIDALTANIRQPAAPHPDVRSPVGTPSMPGHDLLGWCPRRAMHTVPPSLPRERPMALHQRCL